VQSNGRNLPSWAANLAVPSFDAYDSKAPANSVLAIFPRYFLSDGNALRRSATVTAKQQSHRWLTLSPFRSAVSNCNCSPATATFKRVVVAFNQPAVTLESHTSGTLLLFTISLGGELVWASDYISSNSLSLLLSAFCLGNFYRFFLINAYNSTTFAKICHTPRPEIRPNFSAQPLSALLKFC
jgi:hypothetical protein